MYHLFVRERSHFKYRSCHISFGGNKLTRALRVSGCKGPDGISARQGERNVALYVSPICRLALLRLGFYAQPVVRAALRGWRGKMVTVLIDGLTINVAERLGKSCWKSIRDEVLSVYQRKELSVSIILPGKRDVGYKRRRCRTADNRPPNIRYARVG